MNRYDKVHLRVLYLCLLATFGVPERQAMAQTYPDHPISVVVGYAAGGYVDSFARIVGAKLSEILGQSVLIVNRPGAGGAVGAESVMRAKPDGYTLMIHGVSSMAIYSAINAETPDRNFPSISVAAIVASTPGVMTAPASLGVSDFKALMARIKAEPGKHGYASAGIGTPSHFWSAQIVALLGLDIQHVPFAGGAPALNEVMAGRVAWMFDTPIGSSAAIQSGKAIPMAVLSPARVAGLAATPTVGELGFPQLADQVSTLFIAGPTGIPRDALERLNAAYASALKDPDFAARIAAFGSFVPAVKPGIPTAEDFARKEYTTWFDAAAAAGVRLH